MNTRFSLENKSRKELAKALARLLDAKAIYLGTPSMRYQIGNCTLEKDGTVVWDENVPPADVVKLIKQLEQEGFETVHDSYTISFPAELFTTETMLKLERILDSKGALIKKALNADRTVALREIVTVDFPWFDRQLTADEARIYTDFISRLCHMASEQKRVLDRETKTDNEKYSFRCFLLRLGYIGKEHKAARNLLLKNLSGLSAHRYMEEVKDENTK